MELANGSLAMMPARYDRTVARVILDGIVEPCPPSAVPAVGDDISTMLVRAAAVVDPVWAISLIDGYLNRPTQDSST